MCPALLYQSRVGNSQAAKSIWVIHFACCEFVCCISPTICLTMHPLKGVFPNIEMLPPRLSLSLNVSFWKAEHLAGGQQIARKLVESNMAHGIISRFKIWKSTAQEVITLVEIKWFSMGNMGISILKVLKDLWSWFPNLKILMHLKHENLWKSYNLVWIQVGLPRLSSASLWLSHGKSSQEAMDTVFGAVFMREMCSAQNGHNSHNAWVFRGRLQMASLSANDSSQSIEVYWLMIISLSATRQAKVTGEKRRNGNKCMEGFTMFDMSIISEWDNLWYSQTSFPWIKCLRNDFVSCFLRLPWSRGWYGTHERFQMTTGWPEVATEVCQEFPAVPWMGNRFAAWEVVSTVSMCWNTRGLHIPTLESMCESSRGYGCTLHHEHQYCRDGELCVSTSSWECRCCAFVAPKKTSLNWRAASLNCVLSKGYMLLTWMEMNGQRYFHIYSGCSFLVFIFSTKKWFSLQGTITYPTLGKAGKSSEVPNGMGYTLEN